MVGYALPLCSRRLCGEERKAGVNLERIGTDDLSVDQSGEPEGEGGFAGPSGAGNDHCFRRKALMRFPFHQGNEGLLTRLPETRTRKLQRKLLDAQSARFGSRQRP